MSAQFDRRIASGFAHAGGAVWRAGIAASFAKNLWTAAFFVRAIRRAAVAVRATAALQCSAGAAGTIRREAMSGTFLYVVRSGACVLGVLVVSSLVTGCSSAPTMRSQAISGDVANTAAIASSNSAAANRGRGAAENGVKADTEVAEAAQAAYAVALTDMQSENWSAAAQAFEALIRDYPSLSGPYVNAAIVYAHEDRDDDALAALHKALAIDPDSVQANNELGILLRQRGDFAGAEKAYRQALMTDPDYPLALYNLGVLLDVYLGRQTEALALYKSYQQTLLEPNKTVAGWIIDLQRRTATRAVANESKEAAL